MWQNIQAYGVEKLMGKVEYVVCPVCGRNRVLETKRKGRLKWIKTPFDLQVTFLLQTREGGGKKAGYTGRRGRGSAPGSGFKLVPEDSLTLPEMIASGDYVDVLEGMKAQILRVVKQSIELGFIRRDEI